MTLDDEIYYKAAAQKMTVETAKLLQMLRVA